MNKRSGTSRYDELESELIGDNANQEQSVEGGRLQVDEGNEWAKRAQRTTRTFNITQGKRRRHPREKLHDHYGIAGTMENVHTAWEKALSNEEDRQEIDEEYKWQGDIDSISSQLGTVQAAAQNFKKSQMKLSNMYLVGS